MTLRLPLAALLSLVAALPVVAQEKRALDHSDYVKWKTISDSRISHDGAWAAWRGAPDTIGDGEARVRRTDGTTSLTIPRGDDPRFAGRFLIATVHPAYDSVRTAKVDGLMADDLPKDSVAVLDLSTGSIQMYGPSSSFKVPKDEAGVVAILLDIDSETERDTTQAEAAHEKQDGKRLLLLNLDAGSESEFESVIDYRLTEDGQWLVYSAESKDGVVDGVYAVSTSGGSSMAVLAGEGFYRQLALDDQGERVAFVSNVGEFAADAPSFALFVADLGSPARARAQEGDAGLPEGWWVSEHASLDFSDSGQRLFFGSAPRPAPEVEDKRPDEEKVSVDVWSWTDPDLMTVQLVNRDRDLKQSYRAVLDLETGRVTQLADEAVPGINDQGHGDGDVVFGITNLPYMPENSWDTPGRSDVWVIDAESGDRRKILEGIRSGINPSPDGTRLAWWDGEAMAWRIASWSSDPDAVVTITARPPTGTGFANQLHDTPSIPRSNGSAGWTSDGAWFLVYDTFDIWGVSADGETWNLTEGAGRQEHQRYRYLSLDPEARSVDLSKPLLLSVFDTQDRSSGFAEASIRSGGTSLRPLLMEDVRFGRPTKARDAEQLLLTRESFTEFPDLWASDMALGGWTRLSDTNPQQSEYLWGTAELVHWTSTDGEPLDGILYKPDGFDPGTKYPMMVYFYERASDGLHAYHTPAPGRSVINRSFYASRGYLIFVPDIPYKTGYPGESAMNAVMPGVTGLIDQGFVDPDHVGVQGHSWGGYQIAYMVTRTNLFAAAEAGAPVSNMTSAYGGIRWQTGLSRMFQYERTQSRIGGTLWEKPLRYIESSPIFWLDKVETPLLIMHNDGDGHVPWYQGIELFVAMRRLGKPAWMLNYNGEPHWPLPYWKRVDFTTRLQQYFDHYLMGSPAPKWLNDGLPAVEKGVDWGFGPPATDRGR
jgi:dipeptidyl aminopeptidase/acylaminoacyl peptidase